MNSTQVATIPFEHERRFFPDVSTFVFDPLVYQEIYIEQGYLEDELKTRIRLERYEDGSEKYLQTRKTGEGISRTEDEIEISKEMFDTLWKTVEVSLVKSRYLVSLAQINKVAEVNIFHGDLRGYIQIEVEFDTHEEATLFVSPDWFGVDVTDEKEHGNYYLAKHGCEGLLMCKTYI